MRLTVNYKLEIKRNAVEKLLGSRVQALEIEKRDLADKLYYTIYTESQIHLMENFHDDAFISSDTLKVTFYLSDCFGSVDGHKISTKMSRARRQFYAYFHSYDGYELNSNPNTPGEEIYKQLLKIEHEENTIRLERNELRKSIDAILNQATTDNALLKIWPECEEYMPKNLVTKNLPAVQSSELNGLIAMLKGKSTVVEK